MHLVSPRLYRSYSALVYWLVGTNERQSSLPQALQGLPWAARRGATTQARPRGNVNQAIEDQLTSQSSTKTGLISGLKTESRERRQLMQFRHRVESVEPGTTQEPAIDARGRSTATSLNSETSTWVSLSPEHHEF